MSEPIPQTLHMYWRWGTRDACGGQMYYPLPEGWDGGFFCKKLALRAASPTQVGHAGHGSPSLARLLLALDLKIYNDCAFAAAELSAATMHEYILISR